MKKTILILVLTLFVASGALAAEKRFKADLTFYGNESDVNVGSFELVESRQLTPLGSDSSDASTYKFSFKHSSGETLYEGSRLVILREVGLPGPGSNQGTSDKLEKRGMSFWFNYSMDMETFEIRKNGELVKTIDIPKRICTGQNVCNQYCADKGMASESCELDQTKQEKLEGYKNDITFILVAVATIVILILIRLRKNKEKNPLG